MLFFCCGAWSIFGSSERNQTSMMERVAILLALEVFDGASCHYPTSSCLTPPRAIGRHSCISCFFFTRISQSHDHVPQPTVRRDSGRIDALTVYPLGASSASHAPLSYGPLWVARSFLSACEAEPSAVHPSFRDGTAVPAKHSNDESHGRVAVARVLVANFAACASALLAILTGHSQGTGAIVLVISSVVCGVAGLYVLSSLKVKLQGVTTRYARCKVDVRRSGWLLVLSIVTMQRSYRRRPSPSCCGVGKQFRG